MTERDFERQMDHLQARYITALDSKRMQDWLATFSLDQESSYVCTSAENVAADLPVALMLDDNRDRLMDRVTFIEKVWVGTFQDYRTRHFIERLDHRETAPGHYAVRTNFHVMFTPEELGESQILACGVYEDDVVAVGQELRFKCKKAVMDTIVIPRYIVYPL